MTAFELLTRLIEIPSVNPLLPGSVPGDDERNLATFVARYLESAEIEVELQEVRDGRCNVIGHITRRGNADDTVVLLTAHMDTYPARGPQSAYQAVGEGHVLYGRGSADAKGPLAAMLTAFETAAQSPDRRDAYVVATVDEECLLLGARRLAEHSMRPALAVTGEPTSLVPIIAQKGIIRGSLRVRGPASHAAYPTSRSAVVAAMSLVDAIRRLNDAFAQECLDSALGPHTITVTKVESDGGMNLVAREVTMWFDGRFLPGTRGEDFASTIVSRLRELVPGDIDFTMDELAFVSPANENTHQHPALTEFFETVRTVTGVCDPQSFSYGSEAGVLAEFSAVSLVFGPGNARYSHAEVELIDLGELEAATEIYRRILVCE